MIKILIPEMRPTLSKQKMLAYAHHNKIDYENVDTASEQMIFDWIAARSRMTQLELYNAIADFEVKNV
ncbi:MAG: hypothetical protein RL755_56 [Pseudomonadota bacterium]|jgi:hypothetical protein